ncbi:YopX family protein [Lactiplantibacillus plantarum]|uniref:YopX family protein n=1 Tax=Lactiplantibacillus plantarum TaxID=1590 RepID=UPI00214CFC74|nr:YopX family protein [Lactiplantibacillus plantarum]
MATMIKFRAWDNLLNKMLVVYRSSFDGPVDGVQVHCYLDDRGAEGSTEYAYDGDGLILEHFTGLKDVNGKDIYEGDILKTKAGLIQIVEQGILDSDRKNIISGFYANNLSDEKPHTFSYDDEVIGNVHANPELLKG